MTESFSREKIMARTAEGRWMKNPVWRSSCVTPAGTSIDVQNEWEENTHTHTHTHIYQVLVSFGQYFEVLWYKIHTRYPVLLT